MNRLSRLVNIYYSLIAEYVLISKIKFQELTVKFPPESWEKGKKGTVILIQGVHSRAHGMRTIGDKANKLGYKVLTISELGYNNRRIEKSVQILENFLVNNEINKAIIINHSKGGVITKYFLDKSSESKRITKVISISVPYQGSIVALVLGIKELFPKSKIIRAINKTDNNNVKIINLYPTLDNHVLPQKNLLLDGAKNIEIDIVGHTRILESDKTLAEIRKVLSKH